MERDIGYLNKHIMQSERQREKQNQHMKRIEIEYIISPTSDRLERQTISEYLFVSAKLYYRFRFLSITNLWTTAQCDFGTCELTTNQTVYMKKRKKKKKHKCLTISHSTNDIGEMQKKQNVVIFMVTSSKFDQIYHQFSIHDCLGAPQMIKFKAR